MVHDLSGLAISLNLDPNEIDARLLLDEAEAESLRNLILFSVSRIRFVA